MHENDLAKIIVNTCFEIHILLTYLKITGIKLGLLVNFNEKLIKNGIIRIVNDL